MTKSAPSGSLRERTQRHRRLLFTGFSMGVADLVPGVSGGTIALLLGIYDELLISIKVVTGQALKLALRGRLKQAWAVIPFGFLLPVFGGILLAIVSLVQLITFLLENYPTFIWSVFFGLIIGSAIVVSKRVSVRSSGHWLTMGLGLIGTYVLVGLPGLNAAASPLIMLGTGAIAICAMILPGISGSLIMVMLGQYENVLQAAKQLDLGLLLPFAFGAVAGLAVFARGLSWLLKAYHDYTIMFLVGVMLGSLRTVWPWQRTIGDHQFANYLPELNWQLLLSVLLAIAGFWIVSQLEAIGLAREHRHDLERS